MTSPAPSGRGTLTPGQARTVSALLSGDPPPTYREVAARVGIHLGTVHAHLARVRTRNHELYAAMMAERRRQLDEYHQLVLEHCRRRSLAWGRRRYTAGYRREHGRWPSQAFGGSSG